MMMTSCPRPIRSRATCLPIKPVPPGIAIFITLLWLLPEAGNHRSQNDIQNDAKDIEPAKQPDMPQLRRGKPARPEIEPGGRFLRTRLAQQFDDPPSATRCKKNE